MKFLQGISGKGIYNQCVRMARRTDAWWHKLVQPSSCAGSLTIHRHTVAEKCANPLGDFASA